MPTISKDKPNHCPLCGSRFIQGKQVGEHPIYQIKCNMCDRFSIVHVDDRAFWDR